MQQQLLVLPANSTLAVPPARAGVAPATGHVPPHLRINFCAFDGASALTARDSKLDVQNDEVAFLEFAKSGEDAGKHG
jgi:hypothetical protein